jgi:hypothetical protein
VCKCLLTAFKSISEYDKLITLLYKYRGIKVPVNELEDPVTSSDESEESQQTDDNEAGSLWVKLTTMNFSYPGFRVRNIKMRESSLVMFPQHSGRVEEFQLDPLQFGVLRLTGIKFSGVNFDVRRNGVEADVVHVDISADSVSLSELQIQKEFLQTLRSQALQVLRDPPEQAAITDVTPHATHPVVQSPAVPNNQSNNNAAYDMAYSAAMCIVGYYVSAAAMKATLGRSVLYRLFEVSQPGITLRNSTAAIILGDVILNNLALINHYITRYKLPEEKQSAKIPQVLRACMWSGIGCTLGAYSLGLLNNRGNAAYTFGVGAVGNAVLHNSKTLCAYALFLAASGTYGTIKSMVGSNAPRNTLTSA